MQVNLTHHSTTRKSLEVVIPAAAVSEEFGRVLAKLAPKVRIPGFRPGKAPKDVLMGRYGREIEAEVAENLTKKLFWDAAAHAAVQPVSQPALEAAELKEGAEGRLKLHFDVAPQVTLPDYKSLAVTKRKRRIDPATVEEHLEGMREQAAKFVPVEGVAAAGHFATFDVKVKPQGMKAQTFKDQVVQLAEGRPFDAHLLGMAVEAEKRFSIEVPVEDPNRALAGKAVAYEVKLKDLRVRQVPELDDAFAKDLGDFADLKALRESLEKDLEEAAERDALARLQNTLLDQLLDAAPFEVPASMVALQLDDYCNEFAQTMARQGVEPRKINWSAYRQSRMTEAERAVRSGYLLQAIGNAEDIQVSAEEIDAEIRSLMAEHKVQQPFESFRADLERRGATTEIKGRLRTDKIFAMILKDAAVTEEILDKEAFRELVELERKREAGLPVARFDAGGMEGGDLEEQEGGDPEAVKPAEAVEAAEEAPADEQPKKAAAKKAEGDEKPKKAAAKKAEGDEKPKKAAAKKA